MAMSDARAHAVSHTEPTTDGGAAGLQVGDPGNVDTADRLTVRADRVGPDQRDADGKSQKNETRGVGRDRRWIVFEGEDRRHGSRLLGQAHDQNPVEWPIGIEQRDLGGNQGSPAAGPPRRAGDAGDDLPRIGVDPRNAGLGWVARERRCRDSAARQGLEHHRDGVVEHALGGRAPQVEGADRRLVSRRPDNRPRGLSAFLVTHTAPDHDQTLAVARPGFTVSAESSGVGEAVLLLHGLSATRRYVVHGARILQTAGRRVISYDARGHGVSEPSPDPTAYDYADLVEDAAAVLDAVGVERAVLIGQSMGSATAAAFALTYPERTSALIVVTPAHLGRPASPENLPRWDALADGLQNDGVEGFMRAYGRPRVPARYVETVMAVMRQRIARHAHPDAVANALRVVPRSRAFDGLEALRDVRVPTLLVASRDEMDPEHPVYVAKGYAEMIPDATLVVDAPGESPLAWRGGTLSRRILEFLSAVGR
jgi:pimeloyl-ACP methyl ester carboxylesterase